MMLIGAAVAAAVLVVVVAQPAVADSPPDLNASASASVKANVAADVDSVSGSAVQIGGHGYFFSITNQSPNTVTNATVTMTSGWDLSYFPGISALPFTSTTSTLAPGQSTDSLDFSQLCCTLVPSSFAEGFDSTRTMQPTQIGAGGGTQTVQVSLELTDPALAARIFSLSVSVRSPDWLIAGVTLDSASGPTNLDHGESLSPSSSPGLGADWSVLGPQLNKLYTFTYTLHVPNPFGVPFDFKPSIHIVADPFATRTTVGPSTSVSVPVPSLDGATPGAGGVVFNVDQPVTWQLVTNENHELDYAPLVQQINLPTSKDQCMNGGWQGFAIFKNQGDCVSYVATKGKNPSG
jgi:hypothetical protein